MLGGKASAHPAVKLTRWEGTIDFSKAISPFTLRGIASHLGRFTAHGEIEFFRGDEEGSLVGDGIVVFEAANGDLLVGDLSWELDAERGGGRIHDVRWRDSVKFDDNARLRTREISRNTSRNLVNHEISRTDGEGTSGL